MKFLCAIEFATNAYDIKSIPFFYMEHKRETLISFESDIDEEANEIASNILLPGSK